MYKNINKNLNIIKNYNILEVDCNFFTTPFVEIKGNLDKIFRVDFIENNSLIYTTNLKCGMWSKINKEYGNNIEVKIYDDDLLIFHDKINYENKVVYVHLDSSSLGDTLAWFPQIEEFRKKYKCKLICSTFHNYLFENTYPEIKFVLPGSKIENIYKMFVIGWFYNNDGNVNYNKCPFDFKQQHLQKTSSDILGLDFKEIKPIISFIPKDRPIEKKYFCIANHSTAQAKYWNNPRGWSETVDYLRNKGYEIILLSKEPDGYMGNKNPEGVIKLEDKNLFEIMNYIYHSDGYIGLGSGLSWLAWALNKKVFLISGFSMPNTEMSDCVRIFTPDPNNTCSGCFNRVKLDSNDWNWCPNHKNSDRQFECTKTINSNYIINEVSNFIELIC